MIVTHKSMRGDWVGPPWGQQTHVGLVPDLAGSSSRILQWTVIGLSVCQSVYLSDLSEVTVSGLMSRRGEMFPITTLTVLTAPDIPPSSGLSTEY